MKLKKRRNHFPRILWARSLKQMHVELLIIHGKSSICLVWSYYQKCNFHFISKHFFCKSKLIFIVANLFYFYLHILFWTYTFHLQGKYFAQRETKPAVLWLSETLVHVFAQGLESCTAKNIFSI